MDTTPSRPAHANNFNFLRFALAGAVVLGHSFELLRERDPFERMFGYGGRLGVSAVSGFFLISGCLIVASWRRSPGLWDYLARRCRRIYPGFTVAYLVSALIVGPLGGNPRYWADFAAKGVVPELVTLQAPTTPAVFAGQVVPIVNGSLWTIHYEFACYLIVAALGLAGVLACRRVVPILAGLLLAVNVAQVQLRHHGVHQVDLMLPEGLVALPQLLGCFLVGASVHLYPHRFTWRGGLVAAVVYLIVSRLGYTATQAALPLAGGYVLFAIAQAPSRLMQTWNRLPDISYGLYLYAWPIQVLLIHHFPAIRPIPLFLASFASSLLAGAASWYLVERRFLHSRARSPVPRRGLKLARLFPH